MRPSIFLNSKPTHREAMTKLYCNLSRSKFATHDDIIAMEEALGSEAGQYATVRANFPIPKDVVASVEATLESLGFRPRPPIVDEFTSLIKRMRERHELTDGDLGIMFRFISWMRT